ncbi:hypothetical protein EBZ38_11680 [bacterium]|nr:hypothetical protein [bacterium]NDC95161.1 hypothetical protein [bacterium]NDD84913.1 hypothetical protein [bacterium]
MSETHYGPIGQKTEPYRLSPAPQLSIKTEPYYSGDVIIGYTYVVSVKGYAAAYRKTSSEEPNYSYTSISKVTDSIATIKKILTRNSSTLVVVDNDIEVLKAKGGILRSLSFSESPNNWMGYSEYNADIEFNEIELVSGTSLKSIQCSDSFLNSASKSSSIVDLSKYKLKTFTDSWSFTIDDNLYNRVYNTDIQNVETDNATINISYTISATGKHFINNSGNLISAWEQAKNFAQNRLYNQVLGVLTNGMSINADTACSANQNISGLGSNGTGLFSNLNSSYKVFNETISCSTSESDGTFSATYNAVLKRNISSTLHHYATKHNFTKTINTQKDNRNITTISVQGNIEGLLEGGLIRTSSSGFSLPASGKILISQAMSSKYSSALQGLNKIISGSDLNGSMKNALGINAAALNLSNNTNIIPLSFNLTHNYHEGTISYNVEYSSTRSCGDFATVNITIDEPTPVLAEVVRPHNGVLIQDIKTFTAKKITINIEGKSQKNCCLDKGTLESTIMSSNSVAIPANISLPDTSTCILTQKQRTDNPIDGSYSINLGYICSQGCTI